MNPVPLLASSTANRSRPPRVADHGAMTRPKNSKVKRHVVTDTSGLLVGVVVHPADIQDRDGAGIVIQAIHDLFPWLRHLFADSVYNGPNLRQALAKFGDWTSSALSLRRWSAHRRIVCRIALRAFGLAAGRKETPSWLPRQTADLGRNS